MRTPSVGPDVRDTLDAVRRLVQALRVAGRAAEQRAGLSSAQLFALQQIGQHSGVSINELAALTFTHQSSVSVVVQRLVARKLVVKVAAADDRRRHALAITAKGRRRLSQVPAAAPQRLIRAIAALGPADRRVLSRTLDTISRRVAPGTGRTPAPMLFEDAPRRRR
jgi:DNA-binding MarR family transcriptional regulator